MLKLNRSFSLFANVVHLGTRSVGTSHGEQWKNAATLMLVTQCDSVNVNKRPSRGTSQAQITHGDRVGGDIISTNNTHSSFDYSVLLLQRSTKSKFMPNVNVFPGGISEEADFSCEWKEIFFKAGFQNNLSGPEDFGLHKTPVSPPIYDQPLNKDYIASEVAFRICAIRETFEECGILLVRDCDSLKGCVTSLRTHVHLLLSRDELEEWRQRVDADAHEFVNMCRTLNIVPDIWALKEWCDWLTPTNMSAKKDGTRTGGRRYDTIFYICSLDRVPDYSHCAREMVASQWWNPDKVLRCRLQQTVSLAPPQVYELSRLCQFQKLRELEEFAESRSYLGVERWLPVRFDCQDGILSVLPGDDLYPDHPDYIGEDDKPTLDVTMEEALSHGARNLFMLRSLTDMTIRCNIKQRCGHVQPIDNDISSKL